MYSDFINISKRSTIIMQYMTPGTIVHITFHVYHVFSIVHSRHLLHDRWWSERGQSQGLFKKGTNFHNLDKQGWALGQCSLERKTSLHHSLTLPPYGLEGVRQAGCYGEVQSVGWWPGDSSGLAVLSRWYYIWFPSYHAFIPSHFLVFFQFKHR